MNPACTSPSTRQGEELSKLGFLRREDRREPKPCKTSGDYKCIRDETIMFITYNKNDAAVSTWGNVQLL